MHDETQRNLVFRSTDFKELTSEQKDEALQVIETLMKRLNEVSCRLSE